MKPADESLIQSIHDRLHNHARHEGLLFEDVLVRHALERFLYRLAKSGHGREFVLKGGLLLQILSGERARSTRDIDLLGMGAITPEHLGQVVADCAALQVEDDGWRYDSQTCRVTSIRAGAAYPGIRATFVATLGRSRVSVRIDVGTGDAVFPPATTMTCPTLLDQSAPELLVYSPVTIIAEKLEAMIALGVINSRMKDYFDIAMLARTRDFNGTELAEAIRACCLQRGTKLPTGIPVGLSKAFEDNLEAIDIWKSFSAKLSTHSKSASWQETVAACRAFLSEPLAYAGSEKAFERHWPASGPWQV